MIDYSPFSLVGNSTYNRPACLTAYCANQSIVRIHENGMHLDHGKGRVCAPHLHQQLNGPALPGD
jgi:hypothetical protein